MNKKNILSVIFILTAVSILIFCLVTQKRVAEWGEPLQSDHVPGWVEFRYDGTLEIHTMIEHPDTYYLWFDVKYEDGTTGAEKQRVSRQEYEEYLNNK